jgi:tetratricopeptide (TPR) repeat protein
MGIFDRFRSTGQAVADGSGSKVDTSEQDALRLIDEGHILEAEGRIEEAMQRYLSAIQLAPNPARAHLNHGNVLLLKGDLEGALDAFRTAIKHKPDYAGAYYNIGNALLGNGQFDEAVASYRQALEIEPDYAEVHCVLGVALKELGQFEGAVASFRRSLEINSDFVEAHNSLGITLQELGQFESAVSCYRRALEIKPDFAEAHCNLGLLLLSQGRYIEAWPEFEARYDPSHSKRHSIPPNLPFPQWQGEPLTGKSLVVWPEQGFGDEIQFARYIPILKIRGVSHLTLVCKSPLKALLKMLDGVDDVVSQSEAASLPLHDYWTFPMSLPLRFDTTVETIPSALPYLSVLPEWLERWRDRLPMGKLKVALVWKGNAVTTNDSTRSLPGISTLRPLWSVPGVTFVSLQKGQGEEEARTPPTGQPILHLGSDILDFADTAAILSQVDLVICVDTAIAHLAGALNKPCWILLSASGTDWRWLRERTDSPWYPGVMRLFRQTKAGDWAATISDATQALGTWVDEHRDTI